LLKKSVHDLLFLAHKFLALLQAVRLALDVNDSAVMQYTIQDGGGDGDVAYTGPAAPSARNFSPTLPEGSPTPRK